MALRDLFVAVGFNGGKAIGGLQEVNKAADKTKNNLIGIGKEFKSLGESMGKVGKNMTTKITAPLLGMGAAGTKTFIEMEDAFSGVKKTVEGTPEQLAGIKREMDRISTTDLAVPRKELYGIAETAGQLGVETEGILGFSEAIAKMGRITDLTYEQGAEQSARFSNIMGTNIKDIDRLGSTIVHLDKNLATSASEILSFGMRLAGAGKQAKMSEADVLGIAGALASVGINAESGGTAFSKVILDMSGAVQKGGVDLELYGAIAGTTGAKFKQAFEKDAAGAVAMFIEGLGRLQKRGANVTEVIEEMGFKDFRVADALRRAAGSSDLFKESILAGNKAWEENIALNDTFRERTDNTLGKIDIAKNKISLAFEDIGAAFKENLGSGIKIVGNVADWFTGLDKSQQKFIVKIGTMVAAIGPALLIGSKLMKGISSITTGFSSLSKFAGDASFAFQAVKGGAATLAEGLGFLLGPTGIAIAAIGGLVVAGILLYRNWDKIKAGAGELCESISAKFQAWFPHIQTIWENLVAGIDFGLGILKAGFQIAFPFIRNIVLVTIDTIVGVVGGLLRTLSGVTEFIAGVFTGDWERAWAGVKDVFGGIWDGISSIAKGAINNVIGFINAGIENINKLKVPDWVPGIGGKGINIGKIPYLATGTNFFPGGQAIVGEKGPELITMPRGSRVDTNTALRNITPETTQNNQQYSSGTFAPQINISIEGDASIKEQIPDIKKEVEKTLYPLLEEYWAQMRIKRPSMI